MGILLLSSLLISKVFELRAKCQTKWTGFVSSFNYDINQLCCSLPKYREKSTNNRRKYVQQIGISTALLTVIFYVSNFAHSNI